MQKSNTDEKRQTSSRNNTPKKVTESRIKSPIKTPKKVTNRLVLPTTGQHGTSSRPDISAISRGEPNLNEHSVGKSQELCGGLQQQVVGSRDISGFNKSEGSNNFLAPKRTSHNNMNKQNEDREVLSKARVRAKINNMDEDADKDDKEGEGEGDKEDGEEMDKNKKKKDWKSWSLNEKLLFYEAIANGVNYTSLHKLFKNMNDVSL
jgi:hypothetical protein